MSFAAQFPGKCSTCGEWFTEGTPIARDDSRHGYHHTDCTDSEDTALPSVAREVCTSCWLEKSTTGECGCDA